jgi:hypothetical protein
VEDTVLTVPKVIAEVGTKVIDRPADVYEDPKKVFVDSVVHNSPIVRLAGDALANAITGDDMHTNMYGPFGGRADWMGKHRPFLDDKRIDQIIMVSYSP